MNDKQPRVWKRLVMYNLMVLFWNDLKMTKKNYGKPPLIFSLKDMNPAPLEYKPEALLIHQYAMSVTS
jgi:hypothetical protein